MNNLSVYSASFAEGSLTAELCPCFVTILIFYRAEIQPYKHLLFVRKITNYFSYRHRYLSYQCRNCKYLIPGSQLGMQKEVNNFETIFITEVLLTILLKICKRRHRLSSIAGDIQTQFIFISLFFSR